MSRSRSFNRNASAYRRGKPKAVPSGKIILIVTEGAKTEPNYLKTLRTRFQLAATDIEIVHPEGTDPITLTKRAIELRDQRKKEKKKGGRPAYNEVWVVFDLEKTHDERRKLAKTATSLPAAKGLRFATSDPCFEYWLLLHEEYTTASFADCAAVTARLKTHWPAYSKGQTPVAGVMEKVPKAVGNAQRVRNDNKNSGRTNPATDIDLLVRSLNTATRPHLQFALPPETGTKASS